MSVQFGIWNQDGGPVDSGHVDKARALLASYGPDSCRGYQRNNISVLYHAFHTTKESRQEIQPYVTSSGAILVWDGRLDNRAGLLRQLHGEVTAASTDIEIVASAYEHWGNSCFAKLLGDWALSLCEPHNHSLLLAKDPIGTRHLYYRSDGNQVIWSTTLDPLVLLAEKTFALCEEYIAGWFSFFPSAHLTPYHGIHSVPPSSSVQLGGRKHTVRKYWDFDPAKRIRYGTDAEYEEHFRVLFGEAVRRRLRSESPVLAELSGGMDSTSIVCMADAIIARGEADTPRLDTLSYYNDAEPNWNERPYFTKVEEKRGRTGCHIEVGAQQSFRFDLDNKQFMATPGCRGGPRTEASHQFAAWMKSEGSRVVLSGIGGDEVMGGVPTPTPELADLLARAKFRMLAHQVKAWALIKRKPWLHLVFESMRGFFPPALVGVPKNKRPAPWLNADFVKRNRSALQGYETRRKLFGALPTFQDNRATLQLLQRQLSCDGLPTDPPREKRYPYLDRDLLEFLYAVPREQLVRPGQRRSLMRRALVGIVPDEVLNRKRKAFVVRAPLAAIAGEWSHFTEMTQNMLTSSLGIVDANGFSEVLRRARHGQEVPVVALMRTQGIELWLGNLAAWRVFSFPTIRPDAAGTRPWASGYKARGARL
jgi:asparagine synthase (glutamine-hydrolysing)